MMRWLGLHRKHAITDGKLSSDNIFCMYKKTIFGLSFVLSSMLIEVQASSVDSGELGDWNSRPSYTAKHIVQLIIFPGIFWVKIFAA